jgi:hypothetical protein
MTDDFNDPERPGDDVSDDSMASAEAKSRRCPFCSGGGWATIYHMNYTGEAVIDAYNGYGGHTKKIMRTVAYCVCAAGRKMMSLHRKGSRDEYVKVVDLHDVTAGRHPEWQVDDPTIAEPMTAAELANLPRGLRDALKRFRAKPDPLSQE